MTATVLALAFIAADGGDGSRWPAFRGDGDGISKAANLPLKWSATENIAWTIDLPGIGQSSPVVWNDAVFATSVSGTTKDTLHVLAFGLNSGEQLWHYEGQATKAPPRPAAPKGAKPAGEKAAKGPPGKGGGFEITPMGDYVSKAAPTPAVDAERVYAFFETGDLLAFTHKGELAWKKSLTEKYGPVLGNHGLGASLALTKDHVVVVVDHDGPCYIAAFDKKSGEVAWKKDRKEKTVAWSSPVVASTPAGQVVVTSAPGRVEAYSATNGEVVWQYEGVKGNTVPSPTVSGGLVLIGSSEPDSNIVLKEPASGGAATVAWKSSDASSSFGSPLAFDGAAYFVNRSGAAYCLDLHTGRKLWSQRLPAACWASPIGAGDRVYFFTKDGATVVMKAGDKPTKLAENVIPTSGGTDRVYGVAAVDGAFVVRMQSRLVRIGKRS